MAVEPIDERPHDDAAVEEWVFAAWSGDGVRGVVSGHRLFPRAAWYWAAYAEQGRPLLHVTEFDITRRADPFIVKASELWAEHHCDAPLEQWSVGNETYAAALEDAQEALGRAYGERTSIAFDLEWYAVDEPAVIDHGYTQHGVVHGVIEISGRHGAEFVEVPAQRWHRWSEDRLEPIAFPSVRAHTGVRAPFGFPDGTISDLVLTAQGWRSRPPRREDADPASSRS